MIPDRPEHAKQSYGRDFNTGIESTAEHVTLRLARNHRAIQCLEKGGFSAIRGSAVIAIITPSHVVDDHLSNMVSHITTSPVFPMTCSPGPGMDILPILSLIFNR